LGHKRNAPGCNCCGPNFPCFSCSVAGTLFVTDPVYGVTVPVTAHTVAGNTSWTGSGSIIYPGYAGATGGAAPATTATIAYVLNCSLNSLKVQAGQGDPATNASWPGSASPPNFGLSGVLSPMSASRLTSSCSGGGFALSMAGTTAGSFLMSNLFRVDAGQHSFTFLISS
jgi:hypothetical protein